MEQRIDQLLRPTFLDLPKRFHALSEDLPPH
jgi:hypothetical protein